MNSIRSRGLLLLLMLALSMEVQSKYPYQSCFEVASSMHKVPLDLLLAVAATESNYDANALSNKNAHGIMQIQWPGTARHLGIKRVAELYNPCLNIATGARYLRQLLDQFENESTALAAYNYGPTRIASTGTIPSGAKKYIATVSRHRNRILRGSIPKSLRPQSEQLLATFNSKLRADRVASHLSTLLEGAVASVTRQSRRSFAVILAVGGSGLTLRDQITLKNLGWAT